MRQVAFADAGEILAFAKHLPIGTCRGPGHPWGVRGVAPWCVGTWGSWGRRVQKLLRSRDGGDANDEGILEQGRKSLRTCT